MSNQGVGSGWGENRKQKWKKTADTERTECMAVKIEDVKNVNLKTGMFFVKF